MEFLTQYLPIVANLLTENMELFFGTDSQFFPGIRVKHLSTFLNIYYDIFKSYSIKIFKSWIQMEEISLAKFRITDFFYSKKGQEPSRAVLEIWGIHVSNKFPRALSLHKV